MSPVFASRFSRRPAPLQSALLPLLTLLIAAPAVHAQSKKTPKAPPKSQKSSSEQNNQKGLNFTAIAEPAVHTGFYAHSYAIIIGISHYEDTTKNLEYAAADANALTEILTKSYDFPKENITTLTDEKATRENIEKALAEIKNQKKFTDRTRVVVFFSGHGQTVKDKSGLDEGFLIPYDAHVDFQHLEDENAYMKTCLRMDTVWGFLTDSKVNLHALLIADACYGGLLVNRPRGFSGNGNSDSARPSDAVIAKDLSKNALEVVTAGGPGEPVMENSAWGHGAFTYKLLEELRMRAKKPNSVFLANDLADTLRHSVGELTKAQQTPLFGRRDSEGDVLFYTMDAKFPDKSSAPSNTSHTEYNAPKTGIDVDANAFDFARLAGLKLTVQPEPEKGFDPKDYQKGAEVRFLVTENLKDAKGQVINDAQGQPIIPKATPVVGHVLSSYNPVIGGNILEGYKNGHEGQLTVSCDYILVDNRKIPLQDKNNTKSIGGAKASLTDFNIFGKGKRRMKKENTFIDVKISENPNGTGNEDLSAKDE